MRYDKFSRPLPNKEEYLEHLGACEGFISCAPSGDVSEPISTGSPSLELLDALVFAHQTRIPFDAIDPHDFSKPANLDIDVLFGKIIRGARGGFCFELGALFGTLLKELGFRTAPCIARNVRGQEDFPPIMHRAELVDIDGVRRYADVGYGGPMAACSIPLVDGAQTISCGQRFIMRKVAVLEGLGVRGACGGSAQPVVAEPGARSSTGSWWLIEYQTPHMQAPEPLMYFLDEAMKPQDFDPLSFYCSAHPDSVFVKERLVNLRTEDGSKNIRNMIFTRVSSEGTERRTLESKFELQQVLRNEFGIKVGLL